MVVLEPSCASVFRDEMLNLFPENSDAVRLSRQTLLLSEFLTRRAPDAALPQLHRSAVVHGHCHHKSLFGMDDEEKVLTRLGIDYEILDSGCCGTAGAFGFEKELYGLSMKAGERVLLPRVPEAALGTLIISDGFSCREHIAQARSATLLISLRFWAWPSK
jgi:Fe-S oxidoreductase